MDTFIDKLAQRFSAQDMIRANLAAEAKETRKLREKMESYENLLQEMRQINLKNMESAEHVNRILQEGTFTDKEYLMEVLAEKEELLNAGFARMEELLHTENVKVYRNVQAAIQNCIDEQTTKLMGEQQRQIEEQQKLLQEKGKKDKKRNAFLAVMSVLIFLGMAAQIALQIMEMLNYKLF